MLGLTELLILLFVPLIGLTLIVSALFRLRKKLSQSEKPTLGTYVNELGGYAIVGIVLVVSGLAFAVSLFGTPPSDDQKELQSQNPRSSDEDISKGSSSPIASTALGKLDQPSDILNQLVGNWDLLTEHEGEFKVVARLQATRLHEQPWVVWQVFDLRGVLSEIQVTGFDISRSEYHHYAVGIGSPSSHFVGAWDEASRSFTWISNAPNGSKVVLHEQITDSVILTKSERFQNGIAHDVGVAKLQRTQPSSERSIGSPLYGKYEGTWSMSTTAFVGENSIDSKGRAVFSQLPTASLMAALYFNNSTGNLADIQLVYFDGEDKPLRRRWITNAGEPIELKGTLSQNKHTIVWTGPVGEGDTLEMTDDFSGESKFVSRTRLVSGAVASPPIATTELRRIEP